MPQCMLDHAETEEFSLSCFLGAFPSSSSLPLPPSCWLFISCAWFYFVLFWGLVGSSLELQVVWNS